MTMTATVHTEPVLSFALYSNRDRGEAGLSYFEICPITPGMHLGWPTADAVGSQRYALVRRDGKVDDRWSETEHSSVQVFMAWLRRQAEKRKAAAAE
jgi:hypothetical protein